MWRMLNTRYLHSKKGELDISTGVTLREYIPVMESTLTPQRQCGGGGHHTIDCHLLTEEIKQG